VPPPIETIDPIHDSRWLALIQRAPDASVFHHPAWLRLLREQYRFPLSALAVPGADGALTAGLPIASIASRLTGKRLVALPFSDVVGPVLGDSGEADRARLWDAVEAQRRARGVPLEVHADVPGLHGGVPGDGFLHHVAALTGVDDPVKDLLHHSKRRDLKRGLKSGVRAVQRMDRDALDAFFALHVLTRHKHGLPTQPKRFFRRFEQLFAEGLGFVLAAEHEGDVIAASVYLRWGGVMTMKYNAANPQRLDARPNAVLYAEALRLALEAGCHTMDYGRTELDNPGLDRYKREFGAEARELSYTRVHVGAAKRSVRSVSTLQRTAIQRTPPFVGRLLGAAMYRHFA
jgi:CelD/BcsL family acetyltransferase involved in cellulose biosynthesis